MDKTVLSYGFYIRRGFLVLFSVIFMTCISPLLLPILAIFYGISIISLIMAKITYGNRMASTNGLDKFCGMEQKNSSPIVNMVGRYNGVQELSAIKKHFIEKMQLDKFPINERNLSRFQQIYIRRFGYNYYLDDDNFDIDNHIFELNRDDLYGQHDSPIRSVAEEKHDYDEWQNVLERLLKSSGNEIMDPGRPKWQVFIYREGNNMDLLIRFNHGIIDGINFRKFFTELFGDEPLNDTLPFVYKEPGYVMSLIAMAWAYLLLPLGLMRMTDHPGDNPLHGPTLSGKKTHVISKPIPLAYIKDIKNACKSSFNLIMLSCTAYAATCHYWKKASKTKSTYILIPISMDKKDEVKTVNKFGILRINLTTDTTSSEYNTAMKRLEQTQTDLLSTIGDMSYLSVQLIIKIVCNLIPACISENILDAKGSTLIYSNIPGVSRQSVRFNGSYSTNFAFWVQTIDPLGMGVCIGSHIEEVRIGLVIDNALIENGEEAYEYLDNFIKELSNLRRELGLDTKIPSVKPNID